jgi:5-methylthioadenosine/S-adenosylhomocysteine deaminase
MSESDLAPIRQGLANHQLHAFLIHLSEGGHQDASAAREFVMLKGRGLLVPGVALIHGGGLQPANFVEMAAHGVSLIWSPRSNLELYGSTADVAAAKAAHVKIALAPDWSPTGSDGLLAELNYAAAWNDTQNPHLFSDRELVAMATSSPCGPDWGKRSPGRARARPRCRRAGPSSGDRLCKARRLLDADSRNRCPGHAGDGGGRASLWRS